MHPKTLIVAMAIALPAFALAPRLHAQDVTVAPLEWVEPGDAPDVLPVENHPLSPKFPPDLRATADPEYVILEIFTDEKGKRLMFRPTATLPAYEDEVARAAKDWKHQPGKRGGQPVNTLTRCAVIFNPASADAGKPDATPRVLAVKEVVIPARKRPKREAYLPPDVVWVTVSLDAKGEPVGLKDAPPGLAAQFELAVHAWRFAPARRGGQPVAAELRVPFVLGLKDELSLSGKQVVPRVIAQETPIYPRAMYYSGLPGDVLVDFVVDREGRVTRAYVVHYTDTAFINPALEAVRRWKFEPGLRGGVPTNTHMQVPIRFTLGRMTVDHRANQADLPPDLRYDIPPKPHDIVLPVYPYALLRDGVNGAATVSFIISETGKIMIADVTKATRPEFGAAAIAMVEQWAFEPALKDGRPTRSLFSYQQDFEPYDRELVPEAIDELLPLDRTHSKLIMNSGKLDAPLKVISMQSPVFPRSLGAEIIKGEATVEVLINEEGKVFLPRVVSASDPAFGWAAVQAVAAWRFEPPKSNLAPAITRVRIPFDFQVTADEPVGEKK